MNRIQLALIALLLIGTHCRAQINTASFDSIVQAATATNFFEGTVLIAEKGKVIYHQSVGHKNGTQTQPIDKDSRFSIASVTKLFTAIAVLQQVEEGKFKLTDDLETLLPGYDLPKAKKITVHHLLLHISGLPNETDEIYRELKTPKEFVLTTLAGKNNRFGSFNYANIDYTLLGLIIEKFDNKTWQQSVQERILDKTEMRNTGFLARGNYPENFAYSSSFDDKGLRQSDPLFFIENFYAAGCMYSTATDLLKLDQAMYSEKLLTEESKKRMYTSYPEYNYSGYSVWAYNYPFAKSKPKVMERRGGILGANSVLIRMLDLNKTIVVLSNNNKFNPDSFGATEGLKEALMIEVANVNTN